MVEISGLAPLERRLLCRAAALYFRSIRGHATMDELGNLPEDHPRRLIAEQRLAHALLFLLVCAAVPVEVLELALQEEDGRIDR